MASLCLKVLTEGGADDLGWRFPSLSWSKVRGQVVMWLKVVGIAHPGETVETLLLKITAVRHGKYESRSWYSTLNECSNQ